MVSQVTIFTVALLGFACTANYGRGYGGVGAERVEDGYGVGAIGEYGVGQNYSPKPYHFHYFSDDGRGNSHYRNEHIDQTGTVRGTYGYRDARGHDRVVEYVADARGFHAKITTNEPGTDDRENPAAVNIVVKKPPAVIQHPCNNAVGAGCNGSGIERVHREEAVMEIDVNKLLSGMKKPIHSTAGKSTVKDYVKDIGSG